MSSSDLYVDGFPHGTPEGYDDGCRGGACPTGVAYGLSCKTAKAKSRGDFQYRKLVKAGASIPEIAEALGLIGAESLPAPTKKPKHFPTAREREAAESPATAKPTPTPATAKGGVSLADAATALVKAGDVAKVSVTEFAEASAATTEPERFLPTHGTEQAKAIWDETAEKLGVPERGTAAPAPKTGEIRAWAREKGYQVGAKGKLPQHIIDHYWDATGRLSDNPAAASDTNQAEPDSSAAAEVTVDAQVDTEEAPEISDTFVEISINIPDALLPDPRPDSGDDAVSADDEPDEALAALREKLSSPRPEWGDVAESVDVEAARSLAVRLEQELAHTAELLEQERNAGTDLARDYLNELGKTIAQEEHIADLRKRLERETNLRGIAERAASFALTKWGEERADNEASHALIVGQAHTINQLSALLEPPRWVMSADPAITDLVAQHQGQIMSPDDARTAIWHHR